jgi:hypothetical protein
MFGFGKKKAGLSDHDKKRILEQALERVKAGHNTLDIERLAGPDVDKASVSALIGGIASFGLPDKERGKQNFFHWWEYDATQQDRIEAVERATAWILSR